MRKDSFSFSFLFSVSNVSSVLAIARRFPSMLRGAQTHTDLLVFKDDWDKQRGLRHTHTHTHTHTHSHTDTHAHAHITHTH